MKFKKFMALALAGVMTFAMAGTVFADDVQTNEMKDFISKEFAFEDSAVSLPGGKMDFTFSFTQVDNDRTQPAAPAQIAISPKTLSFTASGTQKIGLTDDELALFDKAGIYTYDIAETTADALSDGYGLDCDIENKGTYKLRIYVTKDAEGTLTRKYTLENGGSKIDGGEGTYKNKYTKKAGDESGSLTISKTVANDTWATTNEYEFTIKFTGTNLTPVADSYTAKIGQTSVTVSSTNGTFKLKNGESIVFDNIPAGISYEVVENPYTNCTTTATGTNGASVSADGLTVSGLLKDSANTVAYTNTFADIPITGLAVNIAPFIAMFAAVGAAIALYITAKRRVR